MLRLRCTCGTVQGVVEPATPTSVIRLVCYCKDCQAIQRYLTPDAPAYDAQGGTDIIQTSQATVRFTAGEEQLRVVHLSNGGLWRWYTACCRSLVGNMLASPHFCFIGIPRAMVDGDPTPVVGASRGAVHGQSALGEDKPTVPAATLLSIIGGSLRNTVVWRVRGDHTRSPFRRADGAFIREPEVLTTEERAVL